MITYTATIFYFYFYCYNYYYCYNSYSYYQGCCCYYYDDDESNRTLVAFGAKWFYPATLPNCSNRARSCRPTVLHGFMASSLYAYTWHLEG